MHAKHPECNIWQKDVAKTEIQEILDAHGQNDTHLFPTLFARFCETLSGLTLKSRNNYDLFDYPVQGNDTVKVIYWATRLKGLSDYRVPKFVMALHMQICSLIVCTKEDPQHVGWTMVHQDVDDGKKGLKHGGDGADSSAGHGKHQDGD